MSNEIPIELDLVGGRVIDLFIAEPIEVKITTQQDALLDVPFRVRVKQSDTYVDFSNADWIRAEVRTPAGVVLSPITCYPHLPGADWDNGLIVLPLRPENVTLVPGTYDYELLVKENSQDKSLARGIIEVTQRLGSPHPPCVWGGIKAPLVLGGDLTVTST